MERCSGGCPSMSRLRRALCLLTLLNGATLLLLGGTDDSPLSHARGQVKTVVLPTVLPPDDPPPPAPPKGDAFTLPLDRSARQKLEAAEDYLKDQTWKEAVR